VSAHGEIMRLAGRLTAERRPYAFATVVRVERPASAKEGNHALITAEGAITGWIGGACSEPTVVREALDALADGKPRLVVIEGSCASEGLVEVFIEPQIPEPLLVVLGESPAAGTLADLAERIGWRVARELDPVADAIVVATMGHGDEEVLEQALAGPARYVGLVASRRRAAATVAALRRAGVGEETLERIRSPAGLDLGPSSQEEIAVAILAELVAWRHSRPRAPNRRAEAVDPVCGMTVSSGEAVESAAYGGGTYYFCSSHCRQRFEADPTRYLDEVAHELRVD
jgi:xanthine dehydrogenase accessory factor